MASAVGAPSKLITAPINVLALREDARSEFESILAELPGKVCLAVDPALLAPLKLVVTDGSRWLRDRNVDDVVELTTPVLTTQCDTVLYLVRPTLPTMQRIAAQVKAFERKGQRKHLHVAFVPRRTFICEQVLKEEGVYADIETREFNLDIFPLDDDVLTLGLDTTFRDCTVAGDTTSLFFVTRALLKLQSVYGLIPNVKAKGKLAKGVVDMLLRLQREEDGILDGTGASNSGGGGGGRGKGGGGGGGGGGAGARGEDIDGAIFYVGPKGVSQGAGAAAAGAAGIAPPGASSSSSSASSAPSSSSAPAMPIKSEIDTLILLDRAVDLVTPLATPLTMEALLHEFLGIDHAMVQVDAALVNDAAADDGLGGKPGGDAAATPDKKTKALPPGTKLTLHLNSNDKLYTEIRDLNISTAGPHLTSRAKELQGFRDQIKRSRELEVTQIHQFVKAIPTLQQDLKSLRVLVELATLMQEKTNDAAFVARWQLERGLLEEEGIKDVADFLTAQIAKRAPLVSVLRLLCLDSVIEGGLKGKQLEAVKRDIVSMYGFPALVTLDNLERAGLLAARDGGLGSVFGGGSSSSWTALRKGLGLLTDDARVDNPSDIHFVTSGYAPLSIRLVQAAVTTGWSREPAAEALRHLPGPTIQFTQVRRGGAGGGADGGAGGDDGAGGAGAAGGDAGSGRKVVLVCFVGGVTYIEISSLRFLAEKFPVDFIVLATSVISGTSLLNTLVAETPNAFAKANAAAAAAAAPASSNAGTAQSSSSGAAAGPGRAGAAGAQKGAAGGAGGAARPGSSGGGAAAAKTGGSAAAGGASGGGSFFGFGGGKKTGVDGGDDGGDEDEDDSTEPGAALARSSSRTFCSARATASSARADAVDDRLGTTVTPPVTRAKTTRPRKTSATPPIPRRTHLASTSGRSPPAAAAAANGEVNFFGDAAGAGADGADGIGASLGARVGAAAGARGGGVDIAPTDDG